MTEGHVRMFARAWWIDDAINQRRSASIRQTSCSSRPTAVRQGLLIGLLSLDPAAQPQFDLTLHTELAEVSVRRLGARTSRRCVDVGRRVETADLARVVGRVGLLILVANYYTGRPGKIASAQDDD